MAVYALVPARYGSKGVPLKNHKPIAGGQSPMWRAVMCALDVPAIDRVIVSTDCNEAPWNVPAKDDDRLRHLRRPDRLAQDDTPMLDVVHDAMLSYPGQLDDVWLILQPTQPLREPKHIAQALALLTPDMDSVVSVVEIPRTHSPEFQFTISTWIQPGLLYPWVELNRWDTLPTSRQHVEPSYIRDGTVYAFHRRTVAQYATIYGEKVRPLIIPAEETCPLDTMDDWREAERRLHARA